MSVRYFSAAALLFGGILWMGILSAEAQDLEQLTKQKAESEETEESDPVMAPFKTTRVINAHAFKTVPHRNLDVRIYHRFGDIAGDDGGAQRLFGFDNVRDVHISLEYGITDRWTVALGRSKGATRIQNVMEGHTKYALLQQTRDDKIPLSVTLFGSTAYSLMRPSADPTSEAAFEKIAHRVAYVTQAIIGRKFSDRFTLALHPTLIHRNLVRHGDENTMFALGGGARFMITKRFGIIADYFYPFSPFREDNRDLFRNPLGVGFEIETGGHVFHINFTNSSAVLESGYIPYTTSSWLDGEFRFGFTISRIFTL